MKNLDFSVVDVGAERHAAVPTLAFRVRADDADGRRIHAAVLRCQIRVEPKKRRYSPAEESRLYELFGDSRQWSESLRSFLWTHVSTALGGFDGTTEFDLHVACTYDFEVAAAKYMQSLDDGDIPLIFLFSGTVFAGGTGDLSVEPVSWSAEAPCRLPVETWRLLMDLYFPNSGWLRVHRDTLDRLQRFRVSRALPTWDQAFERLLKEAGAEG